MLGVFGGFKISLRTRVLQVQSAKISSRCWFQAQQPRVGSTVEGGAPVSERV